MKVLYLLRHAKSGPAERGEDDHARSLTGRGHRAADLVGELLETRPEAPELVLCSSSRRTRETLAHVLDRLSARPRVEIDPGLYLADRDVLLSRVRELPEEVEHALLVGHNPGIAELARYLATKGPAELLENLRRKFPTAALAILRLEGARWRDVQRGARLDVFALPRARVR